MVGWCVVVVCVWWCGGSSGSVVVCGCGACVMCGGGVWWDGVCTGVVMVVW